MEMSQYDKALFNECVSLLERKSPHNQKALEYYEGDHWARDLGISTPEKMKSIQAVIGWPGTGVDSIEERLCFDGWLSRSEFLNSVYSENCLATESSLVHLDALIFGVGFAVVSPGATNEPHPLITALPTRNTTGVWNPRTRKLAAALTVTAKGDLTEPNEWTFWTPTHTFRRQRVSGNIVESETPHTLGQVPVVAFPNRPTPSRTSIGRSEITKAVRYYTDAAARTLLGMEVNREFYNAPQRVGLNMPDNAFEGANGTQPWTSVMGRVWVLPPNPNEGATKPEMIQFAPNSPAPYVDQIKEYQSLVAAEFGLPESYLGLHTDNPASADAIRALESRLVKRVQRRQTVFGRSWIEVAAIAEVIAGRTPDPLVSVEWGDPATPTKAATADAVSKLVGSGILEPTSDVTLSMLGLNAAQRQQVRADHARADDANLASALAGMPALPAWPPGSDDD